VHRVVQVLDEHLPVARVQEAQAPAGDLELAFGRAVGEVVDRGQRRAEVAREVGPGVAQLAEDEAAVALDVPTGTSPLRRFALGQPRAVVAALERDRAQAAVGVVGPGVVRAAEEPAGVAGRCADDARALVRAAVHQDADAAVVVADRDQRPAGDLDRDVVARVRQLALVADVAPGVGEEVLLLEREDLGVDVEVAVDAVGLDQGADRVGVVAVARARGGGGAHRARMSRVDQASACRRSAAARPVPVLVGERGVAQLGEGGGRERGAGAADDAHQHAEVAPAALVRVAVALDEALALRHLDGEGGIDRGDAGDLRQPRVDALALDGEANALAPKRRSPAIA
jgi:hypothetical protein